MRSVTWEGLDGDAWAAELGLPAVRVLSRTGSTNDDARAWAERGAGAGALVIAERQAAGRGREGAAWWSPPGVSLYASFVLRPAPRDTVAPGVLALRVGLELAAALRDAYGFEAALKWPNDLLGERGKVAGVLCEAVLAGGRPAFVIAGVGVNLARPAERPEALRRVASSIEEETGQPVDRAALLRTLGPRMGRLATAPLTPLRDEERSRWADADALAGAAVRLPDGTVAVARGVNADGSLRLDEPGGTSRAHVGGAVRVAREPARGFASETRETLP